MTITVSHIRRWPVKGLSGEELQNVTLTPGAGVPGDRRFALAHGSAAIDPSEPRWMPKSNFHILMNDPKLAALETAFDEEEGVLAVRRDGKPVARGRITAALGRRLIEEFFDAYLKETARGMPHLVEAPAGEAFTDCKEPMVSLVNLASVRDLERVVGRPVEARRFRANLYIDGAPPWAENTWVGGEITAGSARLSVIEPIGRCAATDVNPATGVRDMNIPRTLMAGFRHTHMGVYLQVTTGGTVSIGDAVTPPV